VRDRLILHAIHEAVSHVLRRRYFPAVLLFLDLPAEEVDVNRASRKDRGALQASAVCA